jgi:hypothetical protein
MAKGSAAWILAIVIPVVFVMGAFLLSVIDPLMQNVFTSSLWNSDTAAGTNALAWVKSLWTFWPLGILLGATVLVWVRTRRAG